jgi:hypothetical protein
MRGTLRLVLALALLPTQAVGQNDLPRGRATADSPSYSEGSYDLFSIDLSGNVRVRVMLWPTTPAHVICDSGCGGAASFSDRAAFAAGSTAITIGGGVYNDALAAMLADTAAAPRLTAYRAFHTNLRTSGGVEVGTVGAPLRIDPTGTTTQSISGAVSATQTGTWTVQPGNTANTTPWLMSLANIPHVIVDTAPTTAVTSPGLTNLDVLLSSRLKPADTLAGVTAVGSITSALPAGTNTLGKVDQGAGGASAWKVDGSAVTQPVSGTITANAGTNLNTSALLLDATLTGRINTQGQKTMAGSTPVVLPSDQSAIPVTQNGAWSLTANAGTNLNTSNLDVALSTRLKPTDTLAGVTALGSITNALPAGANSIGSVTANAGTNLNTSALLTDTTFTGRINTQGQKTMATSTPVVIANDQSAVSFTPPSLAKGTQGGTGVSTQDLKDAGRTAISFYANAVAAGATGVETLITLTQSKGMSATSAAASYTVTSGKTLRIMALNVASRGHATATAQITTFNLRLNTGGACVVGSTPILAGLAVATPATASAWDRLVLPLGDGYEIVGNGTISFCLSANAVYTTNAPTWYVNLIGFEY